MAGGFGSWLPKLNATEVKRELSILLIFSWVANCAVASYIFVRIAWPCKIFLFIRSLIPSQVFLSLLRLFSKYLSQ